MPKGLKGFQKGHKSFSGKGRFKKGEHHSSLTEFKKGQSPWNKGIKASDDDRMKRFVDAGHKARNGMVVWNKGKKLPPLSAEHKEKISLALRGKYIGPENSNWKGGITSDNEQVRASREFKEWRKKVFKRDDWTCQLCGARGVTLHPHHIKEFALFPKLRFVVSNGITYCEDCHRYEIHEWKRKIA